MVIKVIKYYAELNIFLEASFFGKKCYLNNILY